jgi:hypothetical protein
MIPTLNYPQPLPDAIVLDLTKRFTGSPGNALVRLNPKIAQTFSLSDLIDLQDWYYNGEGEQEDFVKFELLPQLVTAVLGKDDITEEGKFLNEYLIDTAGSIGGGSDEFYKSIGTRYEDWKKGRLYVTVLEIDSDGDYRTGELYIPFWLTDQLLSVNAFENLKDKLPHIVELERNAIEDQLAEFLDYNLFPYFTYVFS